MSLTAALLSRGRFVALCDQCRAPVPHEIEADDLAAAAAALTTGGWLQCALRGRADERWVWLCPACNPVRLVRARRARQVPP
jgi:hypothetical protein